MNTLDQNARFSRRTLIPAFASLLLLAVGACQQNPTTAAGATLGGSSSPYSQYYTAPTTPNNSFPTTSTTGATGSSAGLVPSSSLSLANSSSFPSYLYGMQSSGYNWQAYYQQSFWNSLFSNYSYTSPSTGIPLVYQAVSNVALSSGEASHTAGTPCSALGNYQTVGTIADCGNGQCYGNEVACKDFVTENTAHADGQQVVIDFFITAENSHIVGGLGCPSGYTVVGSAADCGDGTCYGNQLYCQFAVPSTAVTSSSTVVQDVIITPANTHVVGGPGCPAGYTPAGSNADCGNGQCYGNQLVCVKKVAL